MQIFQEYHNQLTCRRDLMEWFAARGLSPAILSRFQVGWDNAAITIPIFDDKGTFLFFKYRRSPFHEEGPKYWYDKGSAITLFNAGEFTMVDEIIICEGEFDCMILQQNGFRAVTSTGGAMSFKEEWAPFFESVKRVYICLDNDEAGEKGAIRIARMIPGAKIMCFPANIGNHGDVTDFFTKLGKTSADFEKLFEYAQEPEPLPEPKPEKRKHNSMKDEGEVAAAKAVDMRDLVATPVNSKGFTRCPFHNEKSASFKIYPDNHAHCYGCDWHGDSIDYVMKTQDLTFKQAVKSLLKQV